MKNAAADFGVNTYSYIFDGSAADTVARLADQGYGGVELMFFSRPSLAGRTGRYQRPQVAPSLRDPAAAGGRQHAECRHEHRRGRRGNARLHPRFTCRFVRCAGELGAGGIIVGPGKANPLFPMPRDRMISLFLSRA